MEVMLMTALPQPPYPHSYYSRSQLLKCTWETWVHPPPRFHPHLAGPQGHLVLVASHFIILEASSPMALMSQTPTDPVTDCEVNVPPAVLDPVNS